MGVITWHWNCGQTAADRAKLCIEMYWEVVGGLSIGAYPNPANTPLTPKIGDLKTPLLNYGQTVADGATFCTDRRCEVIIIIIIIVYRTVFHAT